MKRKQVDYSQYQNLLDQDDNSNDGAYTEEEEHQHNKKAKTVVKRERDERFSSSDDSDDSDATASWSSATGRPGKDLPLRAMKQSVVNWYEPPPSSSLSRSHSFSFSLFVISIQSLIMQVRHPTIFERCGLLPSLRSTTPSRLVLALVGFVPPSQIPNLTFPITILSSYLN
jgi:hypothetical protein